MRKTVRAAGGELWFERINVTALILITAAVAYPVLFVIIASVSDPALVVQGKVWLWPEGWTFDAYARIFENKDIMRGYANTLLYTTVGTAVNVVLTIMAAYPLSRKDVAFRNLIMFFIVFTMYFSGGLIPTYLVVRDLGLINSMWAVILPGAVGVWNVIIMRTFFQQSIPAELQEAAVMDGCSNMRLLLRIVLPLSLPVIAVMVLFYAVGHWNSYFSALIYLNDQEKQPLQLVLREILVQNQSTDMLQLETSARQVLLEESLKYAVIVFANLPILMLYPFLQKYFVKGMLVGSIKG